MPKSNGSLKALPLHCRKVNSGPYSRHGNSTLRPGTDLRLTDFDPDAEWRRSSINSERRKDSAVLSPWRTELRGKPISSQRIGRFRERLTRDQVAIIERECADLLRDFGYQATTGPIPNAN